MNLNRSRGPTHGAKLTEDQRRAVVSAVMSSRGKLRYPIVPLKNGKFRRRTEQELVDIRQRLDAAYREAEALGLDVRPPHEGGMPRWRIERWMSTGRA